MRLELRLTGQFLHFTHDALGTTQRGQLLAQPSDSRGQGRFIDNDASGGARDERRLGRAYGQAAARVFHGLGVELALKNTARDDHLGNLIG